MQPCLLLHKILENSHVIKHKTRQASLVNAVDAILHGGKLSLTSIGRHMTKPIKARSKIQTTNYLLGNGQLYTELPGIYAAITKAICSSRKELFILIDWSSVVPHETHLLRASLVVKGRSMVLYEELHSEKKLGNSCVQKAFLNRLHQMLPTHACVCIVTDAGFKTDFFQQVLRCGWHFVGRLLGNLVYTHQGKNEWKTCSSLFAQADEKARFIGSVELSKASRLKTNLYQMKKLPKAKKSSK